MTIDPPGPESEVLEHGTPRTRSRPTHVVAAVLALVGMAVWAGHAVRAAEETQALSACTARAGSAVEGAEDRLAAMWTYIAPGLGRADPALDAALLGLVEEQARHVEAPVTAALVACRKVSLWPCSRERRQTRAAYVALLEAEQDRLGRVAAHGVSLFTGAEESRALAEEAQAGLQH